LAPGGTAPPREATSSAEPSRAATTAASAATGAATSAQPSALPSEAAASAAATTRPTAQPSPTTGPLTLEVVKTQAWTDYQDNVRANVLLRNPYEFPVQPNLAFAKLVNGAGEMVKQKAPYFLDGISGGGGYLLPGETVAATVCFNCEQAPISEAWEQVEFVIHLQDASGLWETSTEVEASAADVTFEAGKPLFWIKGTVKNNGASTLSRISYRVVVLDEDGKLVGAAEASAWEVAAGATAEVSGYGIGEAPTGKATFEVSALGVNY
jgi:hypothetical protein